MFKMVVQQGRREVHGAKNNERHVCGRRRGCEPAVSQGRGVTFLPAPPRLPGQVDFPMRGTLRR